VEVTIKASKTDVFRKGVPVVVGAMRRRLCPVAAILQYIVHTRPAGAASPKSFFMFSDGSPLTRERFVKEMRVVLGAVGIKAEKYAAHSFWIGAATTAARCGMNII